MFFSSVEDLVRVVVMSVCAYAALVFLLRISGKRTLSKMNAFDFVVTVALGSTLATILLSKQVTLAQGVLALAMLVGLQYVVAWSAVHFTWANKLVKSQPRLVFWQGEFLAEAMRAERVTQGEVLAAIREQRFASLEEVSAVVLETSGELIATGRPPAPPTALEDVRGMEPRMRTGT